MQGLLKVGVSPAGGREGEREGRSDSFPEGLRHQGCL